MSSIDHFHEHRYEIWQQLRKNLDEKRDWDGSLIRIQHGPFEIVLDVHAELEGMASRVITRLRAPYLNKDNFRFRIKRSNWMTTLATMLGSADVEFGDSEFDKEFVLQSNNEHLLRRLLNRPEIRKELIDSQICRMEVRPNEGTFGPEFPEGVDELYVEADGRLTNIDQLERLYEAFADVLDRLCQVGSAYEDDSGLTL